MLRRAALTQRHNIEHLCVLNRLTYTGLLLVSLGRPLRPRRCNASTVPMRAASATVAVQLSSPEPGTQSTKDSENSSSSTNAVTSLSDSKSYLPSELFNLLQNTRRNPNVHPEDLRYFKKIPLILHNESNRDVVLCIIRAILSSTKPLKTLHFLDLAHHAGLIIPFHVYHEAAFHFFKQRRWRAVLATVKIGQQQSGRITARLLNWRLRALVETRDFAAVDGVLHEFDQNSLNPSRRTFHLILSAHIENRDLKSAKHILSLMKSAQLPPDHSTHAIIASHYRNLGLDSRVEAQTFQSLPFLPTNIATTLVNRLITYHLDANDVAGAMKILQLFDTQYTQCIVSVSQVESTIQPNARIALPSLVNQLRPNAETYTIFINLMAKRNSFAEGIQIFRAMLGLGVEPTASTVSALVNLLFAGERGDTAVKLVATMCSKKTPPKAFKPFLVSEQALDFPWQPSDIKPNAKIFNMLLRRLLPTHGLEIIQPLLRIMDLNDIAPDTRTLETLLGHLHRKEKASPFVIIEALQKFIDRETDTDTPPTLRHMHTVLAAIIRREKYILFGEGWDKTAARHSPTRSVWPRLYRPHMLLKVDQPFNPTAGIQIPEAGEQWNTRSQGFLQSLAKGQESSDAVVFAQRIWHEAMVNHDSDGAEDVLRILHNRGIRPNEYHFSASMEGLVRSNDIEGAHKVLAAAERVGCQPNVVMFTILISGYARQGNPDMALKTFDRMIVDGLQPDVGSIDALASAFFVVGSYSLCRETLVKLWEYIEPFPKSLTDAPLKELARRFRQLDQDAKSRRPSNKKSLAMRQQLEHVRTSWSRIKSARGQVVRI